MTLTGSVARARGQLTTLWADPIASNSSLMMINGLITSSLGYCFWLIATHLSDAYQVGLANAAISAGTLVALVADLGMRSLVMTTLPKEREARSWSAHVSAGFAITAISTTAGTAIMVLILRLVNSPVTRDFSGVWPLVLLLLAITLSWNQLLDGIAGAERSGPLVVRRNAYISVSKLLVIGGIGLFGVHSSKAIVGSVALAMTGGALYGLAVQLRRMHPGWQFSRSGVGRVLGDVRGSLVGHHVLTLSGYLPVFVMPLIVVSLAGPTENAYLALTWQLGSIFFMVSPTIGSMLFVQGRWEPGDLVAALRRSTKLVAALMFPCIVGAVLLGKFVLQLFGSGYAEHGYPVLCILAASAVPDAVTNLYTGVLRARDRLSEAATMNLVIAVSAVALVWLLVPPFGIAGAATAWLLAQSIGSVWVLISAVGWSPFAVKPPARHAKV